MEAYGENAWDMYGVWGEGTMLTARHSSQGTGLNCMGLYPLVWFVTTELLNYVHAVVPRVLGSTLRNWRQHFVASAYLTLSISVNRSEVVSLITMFCTALPLWVVPTTRNV